jgi:hypothetical protein
LYCPLHQVSHVRQFIKNVALVILEHIIPTFGSFAETPHEEWTSISEAAIIPRDQCERNQARLAAARRNGFRHHAKNSYLLAKRSVCRLCQSHIECSTPKTMYSGIGYYFTFEFAAEGGQKVIAFL